VSDSTSSQCLSQFAWFWHISTGNAITFWTHIYSLNLQHRVVPPRDKVNNLTTCFFAHESKRRHASTPVQSIAHIFKTSAPICMIFDRLEWRVVLDVLLTCLMQSVATWWKTTTRFAFTCLIKHKSGFLEPSYFLTSDQTLWKNRLHKHYSFI